MAEDVQQDRTRQTVDATLAELGMADLPCQGTIFLIDAGYCVGRRFLFDGIQAVWLIADDTVRLRPLRTCFPGV